MRRVKLSSLCSIPSGEDQDMRCLQCGRSRAFEVGMWVGTYQRPTATRARRQVVRAPPQAFPGAKSQPSSNCLRTSLRLLLPVPAHSLSPPSARSYPRRVGTACCCNARLGESCLAPTAHSSQVSATRPACALRDRSRSHHERPRQLLWRTARRPVAGTSHARWPPVLL